VASASVFLGEGGNSGIPHNSFSMSVPEGASFQVKLEGNVAPEKVHISVFG